MRKIRDLANLMNDTRIYTLGRLQIIILSLFGVMAIGAIVLGIFSKMSDAWLVSIIILFILGAAGGVITLTVKNVGLITGREGVIYAGQGYTLYTPWNNIKKITNLTRSGKTLQLQDSPEQIDLAQGIREHRPAIEIRNGILLPKKSYSPYDGYHLVAIGTFFMARNYGTFAQDLEHYAPELRAEI